MTEPQLQILLQLDKDLRQMASNHRNLDIIQWDTNHREVSAAHHCLNLRLREQADALMALLSERDELAARVIGKNILSQ